MPEATNEVQWPANTSNYTLEADADVIDALVKESEGMEAPKHYRELITKLLETTKRVVERAQINDKRANALLLQSKQFSRYIQAAEENYGNLADLYKQEHKANLDQAEEVISLLNKTNIAKENQEAKYQELVQELDQYKLTAAEKLKAQEEEFRTKSTKQAIGRKNIEEKLYHKEMEVNELRKKIQEMEQRVNRAVGAEVDKLKTENAQLKMLIGAYAAQQIPQLAQQKPRPPHYQ